MDVSAQEKTSTRVSSNAIIIKILLLKRKCSHLGNSYLVLCRNLVEQECRTVPGPVEVEVQVEAQGASSLEVDVAHQELLPKPDQWMTTEVLY